MPPYEGRIASRDPSGRDRGAQALVGDFAPRDDKQTGSLLVQSVNEAGSLLVASVWQVPATADQGVDQSPGPVPRGRVYNHPCGLVHHQEVGVLVDHSEWDVLSRDRPVPGGWLRRIDSDYVASGWSVG